jgi:methylthioribose-1-phosphate isomerase
MYLAAREGVPFRVYADETRPLLQGSRLTAWELQKAGIDVTLICDNMAAHLMSRGKIDLVITGTDRLAANGDAANKIGTLSAALAASHFGIPFYIACPSSSIDLSMKTGADIPIEDRGSGEVTSFGERQTAPDGIKTENPAFDVTPHSLITGIITEKTVIRPPFGRKLKELYSQR